MQLAVGGGRIYVSGLGEKAADTLTALDVVSGVMRWQIGPGIGFGGQQALAAAEGVVILTSSEELRGRVVAFDATDGSRLWEIEVPPSHQTIHSTAVSGGVVYVSIWGEVPAFGD